jgi:3-methylcrotonyl-CoA carboxylase alpha subunit
VEIQVFADRHGRCVHLFERDCSVQRRHQKILEEAPAPGMTPERRAAMGAAAVAAARAVGYVGAGTVEFIVHPDGRFHFMEMNTRLQVEHPVTEMITGLDLVEWQLRVAAGEDLPLRQEQIELDGHAIEARVCAEDPERGFLPSTGRLVHLAQPEPSFHVRIDTGVEEGDEISPHYDAMIAKLIVWDRTREAALARLRLALAQYRVVGVENNVEFLARVVTSPAFSGADLDTGLIEREKAVLFPGERQVPEEAWLLAALAELEREQLGAGATAGDRSPWAARDGWRLNHRATRTVSLRLGEVAKEVAVEYAGGGYLLGLDGRKVQASGGFEGHGRFLARLGERRVRAAVVLAGERRQVFFEGRTYPIACVSAAALAGERDDVVGGLTAPMPGKVVAILVEPGRAVEKGTPLLVLEAMKMEHTVLAPRAGVVRALRFGQGDQVTEGAELVEFEPPAAAGKG